MIELNHGYLVFFVFECKVLISSKHRQCPFRCNGVKIKVNGVGLFVALLVDMKKGGLPSLDKFIQKQNLIADLV